MMEETIYNNIQYILFPAIIQLIKVYTSDTFIINWIYFIDDGIM